MSTPTELPPALETEKLLHAADEMHSQDIGAFLDWMLQEGFVPCRLVRNFNGKPLIEPLWMPEYRSIEKWLAAYFDIDLDAVARERAEIVRSIRAKDPA